MSKDFAELELNYIQDKHIDEASLHIEWLNQSDITYKYVYHFSEAEKQARLAKKKMDFIETQLDEKIRKDPTKYGLEKTTDAVVKQAVIRQSAYQEAYENWIKAEYEKSVARGALEDMRERRKILEGLNYLYNTGYYSVPDADRNIVSDRVKAKGAVKNRREKEVKEDISSNIQDYRKTEKDGKD